LVRRSASTTRSAITAAIRALADSVVWQ
jgi:hypothetical protein